MTTVADFPKTFHKNYSHMTMINVKPGIVSLMPPNQCDWFFNLEQIEDRKWSVTGYKDDVFDYMGPQERKYTYELIDNDWECTSSTITSPQ